MHLLGPGGGEGLGAVRWLQRHRRHYFVGREQADRDSAVVLSWGEDDFLYQQRGMDHSMIDSLLDSIAGGR